MHVDFVEFALSSVSIGVRLHNVMKIKTQRDKDTANEYAKWKNTEYDREENIHRTRT